MADYVWLSTAMHDPRNLRPFTNDLADNEGTGYLTTDSNKRNNAGEPLGPDDFPKMIWGCAKRGAKTFGRLPDIFFGYGYWVVSARSSEVLRRFNLGRGGLYPVKVTQKDKVTPIGDHDWSCINFGNVKDAVVLSASPEMRPLNSLKREWFLPFTINDDDFAVDRSALGGADIWIEPKIVEAFFVSGPLGDALIKNKVASGWGLKRCRVVEV